MTSWKTTLFGLMAAIGGGILGAYTLKPDMLAGFPHWLPGLGVLLSTIGTACLGLSARDNNKSSEDVGAKPAAKSPGAILSILLAAGLAGGLVAGCGSLAPGGVYQGDKVLYDADQTIATSYDLLHTFVTWERDNRPALASQPAIKRSADSVRSNAPKWFSAAVACRDAYKANPGAGTLAPLQQSLAVIHQAVIEATGLLTSNPL
jgi:hypothetical protein